ncbi:hypothetical protein CF328_g4740 [Tilletia controversa]|nr:hypothetical protein CF328_g4740 [Tilletia controversa]
MHPRTSQAYVRDVTSAFRQVPLHPSQWASTVVEWDGQFYVDLFLAFGLGPACGAYGLFADAFADIFRAIQIATTAHWVDDNIFLRVPTTELELLNKRRESIRKSIDPTPRHKGGRTFWTSNDGTEHTEDFAHPITKQPNAEGGFHMGLEDIDRVSRTLGWPWEPEKDAPWASVFRYAGINYNIATREVSLPESKRTKYLQTIADIREKAKANQSRYQLPDIERLHGQCQWAESIHTQGKWHVKGLQDFIRAANDQPALRHQWRYGGERIRQDMDWWEATLQQENFWRSFDPTPAKDVQCYCDGSTSFGVGLSIGGRERAYPLKDEHAARTDIKIVEALALELAVLTLDALGFRNQAIIIHTDNTAVLGAFKKGKMAAPEPNRVLERVAAHEVRARLSIRLVWNSIVGSNRAGKGNNQADRGRDGEEPPEKKPKLDQNQGHYAASPIQDASNRWQSLLKDWKERQLAKDQPRTKEIRATSSHPAPSPVLIPTQPSTPKQVTGFQFTAPTKKSINTRRFNPKKIQVRATSNRPDNIKAEERFATWKPANRTPSQSTSKVQDEQVRQLILSSFAKSTKKGYSTAVAQWNRFCDEHNVEESKRAPADPELVELWIAEAAGEKSGGYLSDWASALHAWHTLNNLPWLPDPERLKLVKRGAKYTQPPPKPPRAPMTSDWLNKVIPAANLNNPKELATMAAATCGVWGLFRLGELVIGDEGFDPVRSVTRADVKTEIIDSQGKQILAITVDRVMVHGRWDSNTWKRYVREHAEVLAPYLATELQATQDRS